MTLKQHRLIQWIAITLILSLGAGYYYQTKVQGAQTIAAGETPSFQADLKNTLDLQKGVGKPTFTRATTASVTDFEGLIKQAKSGEARFEGARRVENLLTYSEDFSNAVWQKSFSGTGSIPVVTANYANSPIGTLAADRVQLDKGAGNTTSDSSQLLCNTIPSTTSARASIWLKSTDGVSTYQINIRHTLAISSTIITVTGSWQRFSIPASSSAITTFTFGLVGANGNSQTADILSWGAQLENVTGQANQNPSEYVSTNVLTAAPYHGANVDGVKYFTTQNGNTVASNVVTESVGAAIPDATLKGYLAEGQRTNLLTYSEQFDNAAWTKIGGAITAEATVAPDGKSTADKLVEDTNNSGHYLSQAYSSFVSGNSYTFSIYAKKGEQVAIRLQFPTTPFGGVKFADFNLDTGIVGASSGTLTTSIINVGNGWFKCSITATATASGSGSVSSLISNYSLGYVAVYTGDGTSGIYIWGAQLEQASFASSYIPTTTASVTRNTDSLSYPKAGNFSDTAGSAYAEDSVPYTSSTLQATLALSANTVYQLSMFINSTWFIPYFGNGVSLVTTNPKASNPLPTKKAVRWNGTIGDSFANGVKATTSATGINLQLTTIYIGHQATGFTLFGTIRNVKIWKKALTDGQLTNMTSATDAVANSAVKGTTVGTDGASFQADLKNTLDLQKGQGKPTFTRATTASVTDFEGLIRTAKSGEARFEGARRVENLLSDSDNMDSWAYLTGAVKGGLVADPKGGNNARRVTLSSPTDPFVYKSTTTGLVANRTFRFTGWVKGVGTAIGKSATLYTYGGTGSENATTATITLSSSWQRVSVISTFSPTAVSTTFATRFETVQTGFVDGDEIHIFGAQLEDVTGQANKNPSEYVSVGVLSAPYHGANVDGVKYFTTYNGNTVASNVVTEATGAAIPGATLKGYLAEGSRTNLPSYSEQFDNASWTKYNSSTVTPGTATAPNGTLTAYTWARTLASASHMYQVVSKTASPLTYTYSAFVKPNTGRYFGIILQGTYPNAVRAVFDLQTGAISSSANVVGTFTSPSATIAPALNGFYRVTLTGTSDSAAGITPYVSFNSNGVNADGTDSSATSSGFIWGAQLEQASFASSYIPTTTASVTRNADILTYPTAGNVLPSVGTYYAEAVTNDKTNSNANALVYAWTDTSNINALQFYNNQLRGVSQNAGVLVSDIRAGAITTNTKYKAAYRYDTNNFGTFLDGTKVGSDTSGTPISSSLADSFGVGNSPNGGQQIHGTIRNVKIWKKALTDGQLTNMTSATDAVANSAVKKTLVNVGQNTKLTNGLVGFWPLNGYDVSGTAAYDRSGSNNNGVLTNGPGVVGGKVGQALSFNGTNQYINIGASSSSVKTVAFWIKPSSTTQSILDLNGTQTIDISAGTVRGNSFTSPTIYVDGAATSTLSTTDWHHIAITTGTNINASAFAIGKIASSYLSGKIDEVRIYNRALSATEVQDLYQMGR